jgi:hypothetical protein
MQAKKILKSLLVLLIPVLIGLSYIACNMAEQTALHTGAARDYGMAFSEVFLVTAVLSFVAFLWSLPVILIVAMIYRLLKGFN